METINYLTAIEEFTTKEFLGLHRYCRKLAFLQAYLDESGTHDGSLITTVGGGIANKSSWDSIDRQWRSVLRKYSVPAFHSSDFNTFHGAFSTWNESTRKEFTERLLNVLWRERSLRQIGVSVRNADFDDIIKEFPKLPMSAYGFCCDRCICEIHQYAIKRKHVPPIGIIFEAGQKQGSPMISTMQRELIHTELQERFKIKEISYVEKSGVIPLEIADFLVYENFRLFLKVESGDQRKFRYPIQQLVKHHGKPTGGLVTKEGIREYLEIIDRTYPRDK